MYIPQAEADALSTTITVRELIALYVENHAKKKKKSWRDDESCLRRLLQPNYGSRPVPAITAADIETIHASHGTGYPIAANFFVGVVRKMFNWSRATGKVHRDLPNPGVCIVRFPHRTRQRFVTTVEMPRLLAAIEAEDDEYGRHALWLLLLTVLRLNEVLKSKWSDIDCERGTSRISRTS